MEKVRLSSKGQLVLPKAIRDIHQWGAGTEFIIRNTGNEIVLKPVPRFPPTQIEPPDAPSIYKGLPLTLEDMERAVNVEAGRHK